LPRNGVADLPVPEVAQGISAFALGLRAANPQATVRVLWLNTRFDSPREREAVLSLISGGAHVLANHSGSPAVPQTAQDRRVRAIGHRSDMTHSEPTRQFVAVSADWGGDDTRAARSVIADTWQPRPAWGLCVGGLLDQGGRVRQDRDTLGDDTIAQIDGFVQGVVGSLPAK
jgi:simple sugar transport system substrate-binding protein